MKKILLLLVLGSFCALNIFAMEKKEDGFFVTAYKSIITPSGEDDPLVDVMISLSEETGDKIKQIGIQIRQLDSNADPKLEDNEFMKQLISDLNELLIHVGSPIRIETYEKSVQCAISDWETVKEKVEVKIPGKYEFVTGIKNLIKRINYFIACKKAGMVFKKALQQLEEKGNLTAEDVEIAVNYKRAIDLTTF